MPDTVQESRQGRPGSTFVETRDAQLFHSVEESTNESKTLWFAQDTAREFATFEGRVVSDEPDVSGKCAGRLGHTVVRSLG
jgi:hypothetical protein